MKITQLFKGKKPLISFEVFPPKPDYPIETIYRTLDELRDLAPHFISVTYGAGGGNRRRTVEIASRIKNKQNIEALAHLTCISHSREEIDEISRRLLQEGIENILALRGDPPAGGPVKTDFTYARDLILHLRRMGTFCIGAAAYPEGRPENTDIAEEIRHMQEKVAAGADFFITQLVFINDHIYDFLEQLAKKGISSPVFIGVMPVYNSRQIWRITELSGAKIPRDFNSLLEKYADSPADAEKVGIDFAVRQIADLLAHEVDGIHLYTMNKARQAREILRRLGKTVSTLPAVARARE
ncbi:MAG: methylenetetrahydrofolate reductase [NAD(P)H] [Firmicutes bacterium]|nr:methylenetetrahydrofolate reductase [NAD(P)H] [Bacillota bacterium]